MLIRSRAAIAAAIGAFSLTISAAPALAGLASAAGSPLPPGADQQMAHDFEMAWQISTGRGVTVAVLSTGVEPSIPGLKGRVITGPDYTGSAHPGRVIGTLIADDLAGDGNPSDPSQAFGVAPGVRILSIRTDEGYGEPGADAFYNAATYGSNYAKAIRYAADHGAQVIDVGVVDWSPVPELESAVAYAVSRGAVIVADDTQSGGGANTTTYSYPAALPGVIGVGSVSLAGQPAPDRDAVSAQNQSVLVTGPGNKVGGPLTEGQDYYIDGSTAASTFVAGTAALIKSITPHLSPALVARALALSARDRPAGGYNTTLGFGFIDPYQALNEALKLNLAARTQVAAGSLGQSASATFRPGPALPPIRAVHHARATLAGYGAAMVAGGLSLLAALVIWWRRRSRRPEPAGSEQLAEAQ